MASSHSWALVSEGKSGGELLSRGWDGLQRKRVLKVIMANNYQPTTILGSGGLGEMEDKSKAIWNMDGH